MFGTDLCESIFSVVIDDSLQGRKSINCANRVLPVSWGVLREYVPERSPESTFAFKSANIRQKKKFIHAVTDLLS